MLHTHCFNSASLLLQFCYNFFLFSFTIILYGRFPLTILFILTIWTMFLTSQQEIDTFEHVCVS